MNDKYYTPEIEEFHVGFEFEYLPQRWNWILEISGDKWIKETFAGSCGCDGESEVHEIHRSIETKKCRVKYLDREDIESCGFERQPKKQDEYSEMRIYFNGKYLIEYFDWNTSINNKHLRGNLIISTTGDNYFVGKIKNKSELKRLLKQLGI